MSSVSFCVEALSVAGKKDGGWVVVVGFRLDRLGAVCAALSGAVVGNILDPEARPIAEGVGWGVDVEKLKAGAFGLGSVVVTFDDDSTCAAPF